MLIGTDSLEERRDLDAELDTWLQDVEGDGGLLASEEEEEAEEEREAKPHVDVSAVVAASSASGCASSGSGVLVVVAPNSATGSVSSGLPGESAHKMPPPAPAKKHIAQMERLMVLRHLCVLRPRSGLLRQT